MMAQKTNDKFSTALAQISIELINSLNEAGFSFLADLLIWQFIKKPVIRSLFEEAKKYIESGNYQKLEKLPIEIKIWASMQIQREEDEQKWLRPKRESQKTAVIEKSNRTNKRYTAINKLFDEIYPNKKPITSKIVTVTKNRFPNFIKRCAPHIQDLFDGTPSDSTIKRALAAKNKLK